MAITDAGVAHLAELTSLERLSIGGPGLTDRALASLANMHRLDSLHLSGNFTDAGLRQLEGLKGLQHVTLYSGSNFTSAAKERLRANLPNLYSFTADADRSISKGAASAHPYRKPGTLAPDFTVTTLEGAKFTLSEQRGKVVLLHFWATWCNPCVKSLPGLSRAFHDRLKTKYGERVVLLDSW